MVAGIRTPQNITEAARIEAGMSDPSLERLMPETFQQLTGIFDRLETHYRDMQDLEFTIQDGKLWMLQTRSGKRTAQAALKIAVDMAEDGLITRAEAVSRIEPGSLDQLLHPTLDPKAERDIIASGLPASPGAACGEVVFDSDEAEQAKAQGRKVILVRIETSPEDIHGMHAAEGILTTRGGMTSHAAVVARGMGKPCVSGAGQFMSSMTSRSSPSWANRRGRRYHHHRWRFRPGDAGEIPTIKPELSGDFGHIMQWADDIRRLGIRANADTPSDARMAREFGAEGIGLCRTEHMFFEGERIAWCAR